MWGKVAMTATVMLAATACGSSADQADNDDGVVIDQRAALFSAAATTLDAQSARMAITIGFEGGGGGEYADFFASYEVSSEGMTDLQSGDSAVTVDLGSAAAALATATGKDVEMVAIIETRNVGGVAYMRSPIFTEALDTGRSWISINAAALLGVDDETISQLSGQSNPLANITLLSGASRGVEEVGHEEVRGVETTHYTATVSLGELAEQELEALPPELRDKVGPGGPALAQFGRLGAYLHDIDAPTEVWVDDDGRLRKMTMLIDMRRALGSVAPPVEDLDDVDDLSLAYTFEMYDYGVDVDVEAPPADEVMDVTDGIDDLID